jgi:hypothetical protein
MNRASLFLPVAALTVAVCGLQIGVATARAEGITTTTGALITSAPGQGWTAGLRTELGRREFVSGDDALDVDILRTTASFGLRLLPPVHLFVEAGWSKAELPREEGEGGYSYAYGVDIAVWEHVLQHSPVLGKTRVLGLSLRAARQSLESNMGDRDFSWEETLVVPTVRYTANRVGGAVWIPYAPSYVSSYLGACYSDIDGDLGTANIEGNRDFGLVLGVDCKLFDSWILGLSGTFFGDNDRTVGAEIRCNF